MTDPKDTDHTAPAEDNNAETPAKKTAAKKTTAKKPAAKKNAADKPAAEAAETAAGKEKTPAEKAPAAKRAAAAKKAAVAADTEKELKKAAAPAKKPAAKSAASKSKKTEAPATTAAEPAADAPTPPTPKAAPKKAAAKKPAAPKKAASAKTTAATPESPAAEPAPEATAPTEATAPAPVEPAQESAPAKTPVPATAEAAPEATAPAEAPAPAPVEPVQESAAPAAAKKSGGRSRRGGRKSSALREEPAEAAAETKPGGDAAPETPAADAAEHAPVDPAPFAEGFGDTGPEDFFAAEGTAENEDDDSASRDGEEKKRRGRSRRGRGKKKHAAAQAENGTTEAQSPVEDDAYDDDRDEDAGTSRAGQEPSAGKAARRKMFVSVLPEEQIEVVITEEGQVQEYYVEMLHQAKTKGNIYKGTIHNVDPNLQAAFVSYGAVKNGFLQIDEVHPEYYVAPHEAGKGRKYPPMQKVLKPGQEVLVQVVKEPAGTKGAFLTTYLSLPGRFLVLTPGREQIGVSRKVENDGERSRLREMLEGLNPGPGLGVIVRTVSMGASKTNLQRDLQYLKRTWKDVRARGTTEQAPCLVYQEMDLTSRAVRDYLTEAVGEIWIDDEHTAAAVTEVAETLFPRKQSLVRVHTDTSMSLFERFNLQRQLDQIHSREVVLPSGGRLVIDPTEALTAIDINSGRSGGKSNFEDMAYRTNMEAARMIPLQLRLRDIGGQVVADFIEMRDKNHWRDVERAVRNGMKVDRARYDVGKMGPFGMLEIVRQRLGSSAISISTEPCPCCNGTGVRRNVEWRSQHALRDILRAMRNAQANGESVVRYETEQPLALHLLNNKRQRLLDMEQQHEVSLEIRIRLPEAL